MLPLRLDHPDRLGQIWDWGTLVNRRGWYAPNLFFTTFNFAFKYSPPLKGKRRHLRSGVGGLAADVGGKGALCVVFLILPILHPRCPPLLQHRATSILAGMIVAGSARIRGRLAGGLGLPGILPHETATGSASRTHPRPKSIHCLPQRAAASLPKGHG